jgi:hypothetical protein
MIDLMYINGDSYTAGEDSYSKHLGELLDVPVVNNAIPGVSNDRIFRTALSDLLDLKSRHDNVFAVIGFTFVTRDELWFSDLIDPRAQQKLIDYNTLDNHEQAKFLTLDWLDDVPNNGYEEFTKAIRMFSNFNKQVTDFYVDLTMFAYTLENLGIDYLLFSAANNCDSSEANWDFLNSLTPKQVCENNDNILDIHNFNIPTFIKDNNLTPLDKAYHLDPEGHKMFAEYLAQQIKNK